MIRDWNYYYWWTGDSSQVSSAYCFSIDSNSLPIDSSHRPCLSALERRRANADALAMEALVLNCYYCFDVAIYCYDCFDGVFLCCFVGSGGLQRLLMATVEIAVAIIILYGRLTALLLVRISLRTHVVCNRVKIQSKRTVEDITNNQFNILN